MNFGAGVPQLLFQKVCRQMVPYMAHPSSVRGKNQLQVKDKNRNNIRGE